MAISPRIPISLMSAAEAKALVTQAGGGQVYHHRSNGQIRDADTVKPATSPRRRTQLSSL